MKKRITALFLCLALMLGCAAATAETAETGRKGEMTVDGKFTIRWSEPEYYEMNNLQSDAEGLMIMTLTPDEEHQNQPMMTVCIALNEMYYDVERLNDLPDEELAILEDTFREEDEVEISYMETDKGTRLLVAKEVRDGVDYVDFYTIYQGYEFELVMTQTRENAGTPITDAQIDTAVKFLSDLEFEAVK